MPRPRTERQAWEEERAELPAEIAALHEALAAAPFTDTTRREGLAWKIRNAERRLAELAARLAREDPARS